MSDYNRRMARLAMQAAADPDAIAATVKARKERERERQNFHTRRGNKLITDRRQIVAGKVEDFEAYLADMRKELVSLKDGLATGQLSTGDVRKRFDELHAERREVPEQIEQACTDLEAVTDLDPVTASGDFSARFPSMATRGVVPLPEPSSNGHGDD